MSDEAIRFDVNSHAKSVQASRWVGQRPQCGTFPGEGVCPRSIPPRHDLLEGNPDRRSTVSKSRWPRNAELLVEPSLEVAVGRFHVSVFMGLSHVDPMPFHTIVIQQGLILPGELLVAGEVIHRRREAVASHPPRHAARQVQGVLKPRRQAPRTTPNGTDARAPNWNK